jgi:hypothetical protein
MIKAKPVSLRRKSFGGQSGIGIWWRKRSAPTSVPAEEDEGSDKEKRNQDLSDPSTELTSEDNPSNTEELRSAKKRRKKKYNVSASKTTPPPYLRTSEDAPILGWDDDLCRPIYHHHRDATTNDSFDNELVRAVSSGDSGIAEASETDASTDAIDDEISKSSDDSGACLDGEKGDPSADSVATPPSVVVNEESKACQASTTSDEDENGAPFRIPALSRIRTRTFGNRGKRRRPLSLILTQEEEETPMTPTDEEEKASGARADEVEDRESSYSDDIGVLTPRTDHESDRKQSKRQRRSKKPRSDPDSNSLEKAREYFANLDETQTLVLDAAMSPPVSSKVTRTHRRTNLASPGINREYRAYAKSIAGDGDSGLSPLSIRDYASSRKLHFQNKGEIVDGFLDD